jgi:ABC-type antimicrobial peptide transport system permease subunit
MTFGAIVIGLLIGLPVGVAAGRTLWRVVAEGASVEGDAVVPLLGLTGLVAGAAVLAVMSAAVPAWRVGRRRPAAVLRAE